MGKTDELNDDFHRRRLESGYAIEPLILHCIIYYCIALLFIEV